MSFFADDYRIFCGDLGNDVNDDTLAKAFSKYPTFLKAKVIRDKFSKKTKGFGFVSFRDAHDFMQAMREMNGEENCIQYMYCNNVFTLASYTCNPSLYQDIMQWELNVHV